MFTCRNQSCDATWDVSDVVIKNEGQGLLFRCPMCGARNHVTRHDAPDGAITYEQVTETPPRGAQ
jgi:uncharacterized Zn finger protein